MRGDIANSTLAERRNERREMVGPCWEYVWWRFEGFFGGLFNELTECEDDSRRLFAIDEA